MEKQVVKVSEVHIVFGRKYRWNFSLDTLEHHPFDADHWEESAFNPHLRSGLAGSEFRCHPSEWDQAQALIAAFRTVVRSARTERVYTESEVAAIREAICAKSREVIATALREHIVDHQHVLNCFEAAGLPEPAPKF